MPVTPDTAGPQPEDLSSERDRVYLEAVQRRFEAITAAWPYDLSADMTDVQLQEQGAMDLTDSLDGVGIAQFFGKR